MSTVNFAFWCVSTALTEIFGFCIFINSANICLFYEAVFSRSPSFASNWRRTERTRSIIRRTGTVNKIGCHLFSVFVGCCSQRGFCITQWLKFFLSLRRVGPCCIYTFHLFWHNPKDYNNSLIMAAVHKHSASKEPKNPYTEWISRFLWCAMIWVILDHWSWSGSSQRNAPYG